MRPDMTWRMIAPTLSFALEARQHHQARLSHSIVDCPRLLRDTVIAHQLLGAKALLPKNPKKQWDIAGLEETWTITGLTVSMRLLMLRRSNRSCLLIGTLSKQHGTHKWDESLSLCFLRGSNPLVWHNPHTWTHQHVGIGGVSTDTNQT